MMRSEFSKHGVDLSPILSMNVLEGRHPPWVTQDGGAAQQRNDVSTRIWR